MEKYNADSHIKGKVLISLIFFLAVISLLVFVIPTVFADNDSQPAQTVQPSAEPQPVETAQPSENPGGAYTNSEIGVSASTTYNAYNDLGFVPMDTVMDPDRDVVYMTAAGGYRLYRIDISTGAVGFIEFQYNAERLAVRNGKIYVTLPHGKHDPYHGNGSGSIGVVDAATFSFDKMFDVVPDPYDIEADEAGRVYISSGSGQWSILTVYDVGTGKQITGPQPIGIRQSSLLDFNTAYNKLYSKTTDLAPGYITAFQISDGIITNYYRSTVNSKYSLSSYMKVSPDGKYIFNGSGNIFACAPTSDGDMAYAGNIDLTFSSICFDLANNEFIIENDHGMYICDYDTFKVKAAQGSNDLYKGVYCNSSHFVSLMASGGGKYYIVLDNKTPGLGVTGVTLSPENITILKGETQTLAAAFSPKYATNQNVSWSSGNESVATVSNGVITGIGGGSAVITVMTEDGGFSDTCDVTVIPYQEYNAYDGLWFTPMDTAMDPDRDVVYMTETGGNKLYRIDLSTGNIEYVKFPYKAERLTLRNGKIYVTLPQHEHTSSPESDGNGSIAVVDAATFSVIKIFDVVPDPYDIEADGAGRVYIASGSGQWSILTVYDTNTQQQIDSVDSYYYQSLLDFNPVYNKLYSIPTKSYPIDITSYEISDGKITTSYDSPYHGDYSMSTYMKVSPDGKYIFNGSGNIFACAPTRDGDMVYAGNIDLTFSSICFDLANNEFIIENDHGMYICDYDTFKVKAAQGSKDLYKGVYCNSSHFISLMQTSGGKYYLVLDDKTPGLAVSGITLSKNDVSIIKDETETLTAVISPEYATNQNVLWSSSNESVATVSDGVITAVSLGNAVVTVKTKDGSFTDTCNVSVIPNNAYNELGFVPLDAVKDPNRHFVYMTAVDGYKLYRIDLSTGNIDYIKFQYKAERLTLKNGKIYLALPKGAHNVSGNGSGYVGVIDAATFSVDKIFDVVPDPYDIEADDAGRVYIGSGSSQLLSMLTVYDTGTGQQVDSFNGYDGQSLLDFNPVCNKLYSITTNTSPRYITAYDISDGKITNHYDCPYWGEVNLSAYMKISPDGLFLFNGSGNVFLCYPTQDYDMLYVGNIGSEFNSICFDLQSDQYYIANGKTLRVCSYSRGTPLYTMKCNYAITALIRDSDKLISLQQLSTGKYNLAVMLKRPATVTAKSTNYNSLNVTWSKVDGANGYQLYRSTSKYGTYSLIKSTTALSYTNTGLITGKTYYYKVRSFTGSASAVSDFSMIASASPALSEMAVVKAATYYPTSIKLSWNAVSGASGYQLYRSTSESGTYSLVKTTASHSYTDNNLNTGTTYYYKVRAYRMAGKTRMYNDYSYAVSATPILANVAGVSAKAYSPTAVKLSWGSVSGRSGYEVWSSTAQDSGFILLKTTASTSYMNTNLMPSVTGSPVTYYYKVRAYRTAGGNKIYSDFTAVGSASPVLADVSGTKAMRISSTGIKIAWDKVLGCSGYEVWQSASENGEYTLVKSTTSRSYSNTKLTTGTVYYYKVRAYVKVGGVSVYSAFSIAVFATP